MDVSPLSTLGALCVAAVPDQAASRALFRTLLLWGLSMILVGAALFFLLRSVGGDPDVASIPFLVDTVGGMRAKPVELHATRATIEILRNHLFNWAIWPDFSEIPAPEAPFLRYREIEVGRPITIGGRTITPIPARHTVPAVGYHLDSGAASLVFTGDTGPNDALWQVVNRIGNLKFLIIETAFSNQERHLAEISRHLCPSMLAEELKKLERNVEIYITHLKPGEIEPTMLEIEECAGEFRPRMLQNNLVLEF